MKKSTLLKLILLLGVLIAGVQSVKAEDTVYTKWKKTAPANLSSGDVVVIVDLTNAVAMSNDKGTSKDPGAESITLNDEQTRITDEEVNDNVQWTVTVTESGYKFAKLGSETEFLYGDASNGLRVGTEATNEFDMLNNFLHIDIEGTNYYAGVKSSFMSNSWALLAENEGKIDDSIKKTKIAFFKKVETTAQDIEFKFPYKNYQVDANGTDHATEYKYWFDLEINHNCPENIENQIVYTSSDPDVAEIANYYGALRVRAQHKKAGTVTITAYFPGTADGLYDDAEATCTVRVEDSKKHGLSSSDPLTVAEAIDLVSGDNPPAEDVCYYIKGKVSKVNSGLMAMFSEFGLDELLGDLELEIDFDLDFDFDMGDMGGMGSMMPSFGNSGKTTYFVSDDATKDNQLKVINGRGFAIRGGSNSCGLEIGDLDDKRLTVGDEVILFGPLVYSEDNNMFAGLFGGGDDEEEEKKSAKVEEVNYLYSVDKLLLTQDMSMYVNTTKTLDELYTLTSTPEGTVAPATIKSGDEEIAKWVVNEAGTDSVFTALKEGTTKITVKVKVTLVEDDPNTEDNEEKSYTMKSKFNLEVISRDVEPLGKNEGDYILVTNVNDLYDGDRLIIVGTTTKDDEVKYHGMSADDAMMGGGKGAKDVTVENDTVNSGIDDVQIIILERDPENADVWYLNVGENEEGEKLYLYASDNSEDEDEEDPEGSEDPEEFDIDALMNLFNGSGASLKVDTKAVAGDSCQVAINIAADGTTLTFNVPGKKNTIKLGNAMDGLMDMLGSFMNNNNEEEQEGGEEENNDDNPMASFNFSMPTFNCFAEDDTKATLPQIYHFVQRDHYDIVIGETHWTTVVSDFDVTLPEEEDDKLAAYIVTGVELDGFAHLELQQVEKIKAGVPYLVTGVHRDGLFTLTKAEEQDTTTADIEGNLLKVSDHETADGAYLLGSKNGVAGMARWSEGVTGSGHAYLPSEEVSDGRLFVPILPYVVLGDVTGDGEVDVSDVNAVINIILNKKTQDDYPGIADITGEGTIDVADVNAIINIILRKN